MSYGLLHEKLLAIAGANEPSFNGALVLAANRFGDGDLRTPNQAAIALAERISGQSMMTAGSALSYLKDSTGIAALVALTPTTQFVFDANESLDSRISFTRATAGARVNSSGTIETIGSGLPRFDYNPTTLKFRGLLIEEAATNLALRSEEFDNATWVKTGASVTANLEVAPDGARTADVLIENTDNSVHNAVQTFVKAASELQYAFSVWVKSGTATKMRLALTDTAQANGITADVDTDAGTISSAELGTGWAALTSRIEQWQNGWYRCILRGTTTTATDLFTAVGLRNAAGSASYAGDGSSRALFWGAQLEQFERETSYVPTTSASATRNAETYNVTSTNFDAFYNQAAGTMMAVGTAGPKDPGTLPEEWLSLNDTTANERIILRREVTGNGLPLLRIVDGGVDQASVNTGEWLSFARGKIIGAYELNNSAVCFNGGTVSADATCTMPLATQLSIGRQGTGGNRIYGWIESAKYWNTRLTNAQLQLLSA